jgi:folate-binding protein YgfZ
MLAHDQYDALRARAGLLDRTARGRLVLTGADRRDYLHGLLTNDIAALAGGQGAYAALLTPQGRMISDMRVSELGDRVLIDLPGAAAEAVRRRLADFIFSEDVEVHDSSSSLAQYGLYGPLASSVLSAVASAPDVPAGLRAALDGLPMHASLTARFEGDEVTIVRSDDYGEAGFAVFVAAPRAAALAGALAGAGAVPVEAETAEVTRIEAGRPAFGVDMDEHTIPLEAGIVDRAISLTKGCYVGQEIIIRVLHRGGGRVARHLVGLVGEPAAGAARRGDRLRLGGKDVGLVTSAVASVRLGRPIGLGYVQRDHAVPGTVLELAGAGGSVSAATVAAVPFTVPAA